MPVSGHLTGIFFGFEAFQLVCAQCHCTVSYYFDSNLVQPQTIERMEIEPPWKLVFKNRIGSRASTAPAAYSKGK
ncbi:MAG: hypothetical protein JWP93_85 [Polaromonas sp.]|jgi:hypothetical protein|nr:hypothetical protein [Polaromonas sp.]